MNNPIVPQQKVAPLDSDGFFGRAWYLFFTSISPVLSLMQTTTDGLAVQLAMLLGTRTIRKTQAQLAAYVLGLDASKTGLLIEVTDYRHVLQWTGSVLVWGPGEDGRHDIVPLPIDPDDTTGWQLCDGTTVSYLKGDGTVANYTTPDLVSTAAKAAYLKFGTPVGGPNAATAPTFAGGSIVAAATGITATTSGGLTSQNITAAGVGSAPTAGHAHSVYVSDPTHTHTIGAGTVGADGELRNLVLRPWFRR